MQSFVFGETTDSPNAPSDFANNLPSPFRACIGPRKGLTVQKDVGYLSREIPASDRDGNKTRDFLLLLHERVERLAQVNLETTNELIDCFQPPRIFAENQSCVETRNWANPHSYPNPDPAGHFPMDQTLFYGIRKARAELALAHNAMKVQDAFTPNTELRPFGHKDGSWQPLTDLEATQARETLDGYKKQFATNQRMRIEDLPYLEAPIRNSSIEYPLTPEEELRGRRRGDLARQMGNVRLQHLFNYRNIVNKFPLINFISSQDPGPTEIHSAASRMKVNAEAEIKEIARYKKEIQSAPDFFVPSEAFKLMDYATVVDQVLQEHPEFCAVAATTEAIRERRQMQNDILKMAPFLASCLLPPMAGFAAAAATAGGIAYSSKGTMEEEIQSAYSSPFDSNRTRSNQNKVDKARKVVQTDLIMLATVPVGVGLLGKARQALQKAPAAAK